jgi:hypothetical protein
VGQDRHGHLVVVGNHLDIDQDDRLVHQEEAYRLEVGMAFLVHQVEG